MARNLLQDKIRRLAVADFEQKLAQFDQTFDAFTGSVGQLVALRQQVLDDDQFQIFVAEDIVLMNDELAAKKQMIDDWRATLPGG